MEIWVIRRDAILVFKLIIPENNTESSIKTLYIWYKYFTLSFFMKYLKNYAGFQAVYFSVYTVLNVLKCFFIYLLIFVTIFLIFHDSRFNNKMSNSYPFCYVMLFIIIIYLTFLFYLHDITWEDRSALLWIVSDMVYRVHSENIPWTNFRRLAPPL